MRISKCACISDTSVSDLPVDVGVVRLSSANAVLPGFVFGDVCAARLRRDRIHFDVYGVFGVGELQHPLATLSPVRRTYVGKAPVYLSSSPGYAKA